MKNIHVLPTNKPGRLVKNGENILKLCIQTLPLDKEINCYPQNICVTNDEEIKEKDWCINLAHKLIVKPTDIEWANSNSNNLKKIILTTDQDLIKDGVQAIDDEFLEWFVKNPSCEFIRVDRSLEEVLDTALAKNKVILEELRNMNKQRETLEKAAEKYRLSLEARVENPFECKKSFIEGAKWQERRMYSEEEVLDIIALFVNDEPHDTKEWFEQFKKK